MAEAKEVTVQEKVLAAYRGIPQEVIDDLVETYVLTPRCSKDPVENTIILAKQALVLFIRQLATNGTPR